MKKSTQFLVASLALTALLLASCGGPAAPATAPVTEPATSEPNQPVAAQATAQEPAGSAGEVASGGGEQTFTLVPEASEARFSLDEVLAGSPNRVVGTTRELQGEIHVDPANPAGATVSTVVVGAASLTTDNNFRNRAIANFILQSGDYPSITFTPGEAIGLPSSVSVGDTFSFQLTGNLTVRDITQPVTFDVTVTVESPTRISGSAQSTIQRSDFDLNIPSVPQVADVSQQVLVELDFVAEASN